MSSYYAIETFLALSGFLGALPLLARVQVWRLVARAFRAPPSHMAPQAGMTHTRTTSYVGLALTYTIDVGLVWARIHH